MIERKRIVELCEEWLKDKEYFLVYTDVTDDKITVEIDHKDGVWINDCAELSRFISEQCEPDIDDYELEVGSAGLGQPFKVEQQYRNHVGDEVEVLQQDGIKLKGVLKSVEGRTFTITVQEKQTVEGKKRPVMVDVDKQFSMDEVKSVKYLLAIK
jgi:ribosome maturation factor RimP